MIDELLYKYRFLIGGILIAIILTGIGTFVWQKLDQKKSSASDQVKELQAKNDLLRTQLANQSQAIAGVTTSAQDQTVGDKININTADLTELDKIPSVGPVIAQRIIDYRNTNGNFGTIEDIKNVKGIGDATFEKMKNNITTGE